MSGIIPIGVPVIILVDISLCTSEVISYSRGLMNTCPYYELSKLEKLFHLVSSAQNKPTMLMSNGVSLIIVLRSSTCSSEKGPPYFFLPNSS